MERGEMKELLRSGKCVTLSYFRESNKNQREEDMKMLSRKPSDPHSPVLAHHTSRELLCDLHWHIDEALAHLAAYRSTYRNSPVDDVLAEIQRHLRLANVYIAFAEPEEKEAHEE